MGSDNRARMMEIKRRLRWSTDAAIEAALKDIAEIASGKTAVGGGRKAKVTGGDRKEKAGHDRSE